MAREPVEACVETLRDCEAEGLIDGFKVQSWPEEVAFSPERPERAMIRGVESYREWADRAGVDIEPPFATRTRKSIVTGAEIDILVLPSICLALYDDEGQLVGVYPHSDDEGTYTVEDAISRLRAGEMPLPRSGLSVRVDGEETCPDCHELLVKGRGLYVCPDCGWVGTLNPDGGYEPLPPQRSGGPADVSIAPGASEESEVGADDEPGVDPDAVANPENSGDSATTSSSSDGEDADESDEDGTRLPKP